MVRSPRALTKIAETAEATPASRTQPAQSTPWSASAARMRSLIGSPPGGPPSGPAKLACPPSRAIAMAALAAQPPPMLRNALACAFPSAGGNSSTRKTSSSTAIPVHRMRTGRSARACVGAPAAAAPDRALAEPILLSLDPGADEVMRDCDRGRCAETGGMPPQQHQRRLLPVEPARTLEFGRIDRDLGGERLGVAADHQRHRERPGLRREIADAPADDAGLFVHLAPHRLFDRLARLDEAGEA